MLDLANRYIVLQIAASVFVSGIVKAQAVKAGYVTAYHAIKLDRQVSLLPAASKPDSVSELEVASVTSIANNIDELLTETNGLDEAKVNRQFSRVLKHIRISDMANQGANDKKAYTRMAGLFARLKLYPLAMKCYLKTLPVVLQKAIDGIQFDEPQILRDDSSANRKVLDLTLKDGTIFSQKAQWLEKHINEKKSDATGSKKITEAFNDGKTAIAYALLFHVKQPVSGKQKVFHWINTGHAFITLIKYNEDSTCVTRSFGFYPKKDNILSATPLLPSTSSTFKDDGGHNWDELVGKFISRHKFKRILKLVSQFSETDYQLSSNNCTDFAVSAATIAGIYIGNTKAKWPLGSGNNPGSTGQSIITNNILTDDHTPLFVYKNLSSTSIAQ
jgi:hypothetical protein